MAVGVPVTDSVLVPLLETVRPSATATGEPVLGIETPLIDHVNGGTPPDATMEPV